MFHSATLKMTAWYLGLVMTISLLFSAVLYNVSTNEIARSVHVQSARIYNQFPVFDNDSVLHPSADISSSDHNLLIRLISLNIVVLLLAGLVSYWLARVTLEPIEEAHEQQKRFTADVSHELRTPLTALKMESEVALMSPKISVGELKKTLRSNLEEAEKLERLINNILKLTRLEADELKQNFGRLSAQKVTDAAIKQVEPLASAHQVTIGQKISDESFSGDEDSVTQLLVILLDNAIKYSKSPATVEVEAVKQEDRLVFKVSDHGRGISKGSLEHIFDRFYRSENSRNKKNDQAGYGLGLSIAKMIADVHEAIITVSSEVGQGTDVEVSFPLRSE